MNSRQRVLNYFGREKMDRVPINYHANGVIDKKLHTHFKTSNHIELLKALNVDFMGIPDGIYNGKRYHKEIENRHVGADLGIVTKLIENQYGSYWDYCDFPLVEADEDEIAAYPMPTIDDYDFSDLKERCKAMGKDFSLYLGDAGHACYINTNGFLRGMEQTFVDLVTDDPAGELLAKRRFELELLRLEKALDTCGEWIDFVWIGEDLGTQNTPLISMDTYRKVIKPWHQKYIDLAKSYNKYTMIHTCGSSSWVYNELIEMGMDSVDTLQPEAKNMDPKYLKGTFGGRLCFHGCISTAGPVAYGNVDDVEKSCIETLDIMMPNYEYAFAPTHSLQDNSPVENVVKMYECAVKYGKY